MKMQGIDGFTWQIGYGAFSVSSSKIKVVSKYIVNQKEHHKTTSFEKEMKEFMVEYEITEYDSTYFWS